MTTHELATLLLNNPDYRLIIQKDAEGNGYSPLSGIEMDVTYVPDTTYSGTVYSKEYSAEDNGMTEKEWEQCQKDNSGYAVLYPVN